MPEVPFASCLLTLVVCWIIDDSHSDRCEVISHCGFSLHFSGGNEVEYLVTCLLAICMASVCGRYIPPKILLRTMSRTLLPMISFRTFMILSLICKSSIHFEFVLVYGIRMQF